MVKDDIIDWTTDSTDHFEVQNDFVAMATGIDEDLFELEETIDMEDGALIQSCFRRANRFIWM